MNQTTPLELELKNIALSIMADESLKNITHLKAETLQLYDKLCVLEYQQQQKDKHEESKDVEIKSQQEVANDVQEEQEESITNSEKHLINKQQNEQTEADNFEQLLEDFRDIPEFEPIISPSHFSNPDAVSQKGTTDKISLNDRLNQDIKIGLNDRLAYIKYLFEEDSKTYLETIAYLKSCTTPDKALTYIEEVIKPKYENWEGKLAIEKRFLSSVLRKFKGL